MTGITVDKRTEWTVNTRVIACKVVRCFMRLVVGIFTEKARFLSRACHEDSAVNKDVLELVPIMPI